MADGFLQLRLLFLQRRVRRQRLKVIRRSLRDASDPFSIEESQFIRIFRINKELSLYLCELVEERLGRRMPFAVPVHIQVLAAIRLFAEGGYQRGVGQDHFIALSQPAVSKCVKQVALALCDIAHNWIIFPNTTVKRHEISEKFQQVFPVPGVLGAIDCTHVSIVTPVDHEEAYNNAHHGHHSLNVQMICDSELRVTNLNARYPGGTNDQFIWRNSLASTEMERLAQQRLGNFFILGDSGYASEPWLLTPVLRVPEGSPEKRYTDAYCKTRNCIERCFGVKARWRCLRRDRVLHYSPVEASRIVQACVVLHNMMIHYRIPVAENEDVEMEPENQHVIADDLQAGGVVRQRIINQYFV